MLTERARADFARDGFLRIEGFWSEAQCGRLIDRANMLAARSLPESTGTVFSPDLQKATDDHYFLTSGDKIRAFLDPARDPGDADPVQRVNKIGHALHDLDPLFMQASYDPRLGEICRELGHADPRPLQSTVIFKRARTGGEVIAHQDSMYLYTEPPSCLGLWFALEDATLDNGCLWAEPGGHARPVASRYRRGPDGSVRMEPPEPAAFDPEAFVPLTAGRGTLIVLHGALPHRSGPNRSDRSRAAYTLHVIDASLPYPETNWLQRAPDMPLRPFPRGAESAAR